VPKDAEFSTLYEFKGKERKKREHYENKIVLNFPINKNTKRPKGKLKISKASLRGLIPESRRLTAF
jgi:hypothetical protein